MFIFIPLIFCQTKSAQRGKNTYKVIYKNSYLWKIYYSQKKSAKKEKAKIYKSKNFWNYDN